MKTYAKIAAVIAVAILAAALWTGGVGATAFQVSGSVTTQSGFGIASVTVAVIDPANPGSPVASTMTDASGNYTMSVASGTYTLTATPPTKSNYQTATVSNQTITNDSVVNFTLVPVTGTVTLSGRVLDSQGNGVPKQYVSNGFGGPFTAVTTDATGRYALQVAPGTYNLGLSGTNNAPTLNVPQSYTLQASPITVSQDMTLDFSLPLKQVTVHIQDITNAPVANVAVAAFCPGTPNVISGVPLGVITGTLYDCTHQGTTNYLGDVVFWMFPNPVAGEGYFITATPPTGSKYIKTSFPNVVVTADMTLPLTITTPVTLSGRLLDGQGNGVPNQRVSSGFGSPFATVLTDGTGSYTLQVAPGTYQLGISGTNSSSMLNIPQSYTLQTSPVTVSQDMTLDFSLPLKQVTIHVRDTAGEAVPNVAVAAFCPGTPHIISGIPLGTVTGSLNDCTHQATTNGSGDVAFWMFPNPMAGEGYFVTATPPAGSKYITTRLSDVVVTADMSMLITIAVPVTLSGRVLDSLGTGVPNQQVSSGFGGSFTTVTTDTTGHYTLQVAPGTYNLGLSGSNNATALNVPQSYTLQTSPITVSQDTPFDFSLPLKRVVMHAQDAVSVVVPNITIATFCPGTPNVITGVPLGTVTGTLYDCTYQAATNGSGDVVFWMFPNPMAGEGYFVTATPPAGSNYPFTKLSGVVVTDDITLTIVLQNSVITGPPGGGTSATFAGTGFQAGTQVSFGGVPATSVTVLTGGSVGTLSAVAPAHAPGKVDVVITNPNGQSVTISGGYHYADPLSLQVSVAPGAPTALKVGQRVQLKAMATYNDGSSGDVTGQVQWSSGNMNVGRVDASGMVTGVASGSALITAQFSGLTPAAITVTVGGGTPIGIPVQPQPPGRSGPPTPSGPTGSPPAPIPVGR